MSIPNRDLCPDLFVRPAQFVEVEKKLYPSTVCRLETKAAPEVSSEQTWLDGFAESVLSPADSVGIVWRTENACAV